MNANERRSIRGGPAVRDLLLAACQAFHLRGIHRTCDVLLGRSRVHVVVQARCYVSAVLRGEEFRLSLPEIGKVLGGRHSTTILYYLKRSVQLRDDGHFRRRSGSAELIRASLGKAPDGPVEDLAPPLVLDARKLSGSPCEIGNPGRGIA
jgi:hypothetical protein